MQPRERSGADIVATMLGVAVALCIAGYATIYSAPETAQARAARAVRESAEVDAARRRAVEWATDGCRKAVEKAVSFERTESGVEAAAWRACPDHPDADD